MLLRAEVIEGIEVDAFQRTSFDGLQFDSSKLKLGLVGRAFSCDTAYLEACNFILIVDHSNTLILH